MISYSNEEYDAAVEKAQHTTDDEEQVKAYKAAEECLEKNYGRFLMAEYEDHLEEEEKRRRKNT